MSNPYGWSPPTDGQPPVYFAPPGQPVPMAAAPDGYGSGPASYAPPSAPYGAAGPYPAPGTPQYQAADEPYDNGFGHYQSFMEQYHYQPQHDPFARTASSSSPFSLSSRGARSRVTLVDAVILWLKNWKNFSGRASRSEYWWIALAQSVVQVLWIVLVLGLAQMMDLTPQDATVNVLFVGLMLVTAVAGLVTIVPTLSLTVRRLHDSNHSGWYYLIQFVPLGPYVLLYFLAKGSDPAGWRFDDYLQPLYGPEDLAD